MIKTIALLCLLALPLAIRAQVYRAYVNDNGKRVKKESRADGYILYEKLDADSCWHIQHFDGQNRLKTTGTFKDAALTIAEGKFVYYSYFKTTVKTDKGYVPNSGTYKAGIGYFIDGRETGIWQRFNYNNVLIARQAFVNGKRNGLYRHYDELGHLLESGQYANDKKDGDWLTYKMDSIIAFTETYRNGKLLNHVKNSDFAEARPYYDFNQFIARFVTGKTTVGDANGLTVGFTVTTDGRLINPVVLYGISTEVDKAVIDALTVAPAWQPASVNHTPVAQAMVKSIVLHQMVRDDIIDRIAATGNDPDKVNPGRLHGGN